MRGLDIEDFGEKLRDGVRTAEGSRAGVDSTRLGIRLTRASWNDEVPVSSAHPISLPSPDLLGVFPEHHRVILTKSPRGQGDVFLLMFRGTVR